MQETLRKTVAEFLGADPAALTADMPLTGKKLSGSVGRALLDVAIRRRVGVTIAAVHTAKTYGELEAAVLGTSPEFRPSAPAPAEVAPAATMPGGNLASCGVDIELVDSLPQAADYWKHEFYQSHFTPAEIAYCLLQDNPPMHFAARWCAKEALKKCEPRLLREEMANLELHSGEAGAPSLHRIVDGKPVPLPYAVSISHTSQAAVAVVLRVDYPVPPVPATVSAPPVAPTRSLRALEYIALCFSAAALVLAVVALARSH